MRYETKQSPGRMRLLPVVLLAALLAACAPAHAQKVGTTSLQFLKVMPTARATAMGDAYAALAHGADAVFWNPAGLTTLDGHAVAATQTLWLFDTRQSALGYGLDAGRWGHVGLQLQFVDYGDIEETRVDQLGFVGSGDDVRYNPGLTGRMFSPQSWVVGLTYGRRFTDRFSAGLTAKLASESLFGLDGGGTHGTSARAVLFDFGMQYDTGFRTTRLGASVQNFGPSVRFAEEAFPAPMTFRLGIASDVVGRAGLLVPNDFTRVTLGYDLVQPNDYDQQMHLGAEVAFVEAVALRGGYKFNYDEERWTFGGGVNTKAAGFGFVFDYSYGGLGPQLGNVHRLSVGLHL